MKKLRHIIAGLIALSSFGACVDLNYNEITTNDEDWVYESPLYGVEKLVFDVYAQLMNGFENNYNGALLASATDESDYALQNSEIHSFYNGGWTVNNSLPEYWRNSYTAIHEANNFLEKLDKISLEDYVYSTEGVSYEQLKARFDLFAYEVRALRAYYYFELLRAYGDAPLVLTTLTIDQANNVERTPAEQIVKYIVDECDAIAEFLPINYRNEISQQLGRTSRPFVLALKARTLLYAASPLLNPGNDKSKWEKAAAANKVVIDKCNEWGFKIGKYADLWGNKSFENEEFIFAVAKTQDNTFEKQNYPIGLEGGNSGNCPTQTLVDQYEFQSGENAGKTFGEVYSANKIDVTDGIPYQGLDPRFGMTVVKNGDLWPLNANQQMSIETYYGGFSGSPKFNATRTGYYLKKYVDGNSDLTPNVNSSFRHAWIVMRLSEFYLNYAECIYNITGNAESQGEYGMSANEAINVIRDREDVKMPLFTGNPADFLERYERERLVEFAFEDHRFWDVRRWKKGNKYFTKVQGADIVKQTDGRLMLTRSRLDRTWDEKYNLFPVPYSEIKKNSKLTQNEGW